jgi:UDP-GlcNAc3NAcA epimerase
MSDIFFEELEIPRPDHQLGIGSNSHGAQTGRMLEAIEGVLGQEKPDWVLVYGDTNSTLGRRARRRQTAHPGRSCRGRIAFIQSKNAGRDNRVLTDHVSEYLFAPTETALGNLRREGISDTLFWSAMSCMTPLCITG